MPFGLHHVACAFEVKKEVAQVVPAAGLQEVPGCFLGVARLTQTRITRIVMTIILDTFFVLKKRYVMTAVTQEIISFGSAISACEKGGQWQLALHLLRRMSARRPPP